MLIREHLWLKNISYWIATGFYRFAPYFPPSGGNTKGVLILCHSAPDAESGFWIPVFTGMTRSAESGFPPISNLFSLSVPHLSFQTEALLVKTDKEHLFC